MLQCVLTDARLRLAAKGLFKNKLRKKDQTQGTWKRENPF
jgi:hypothetical protein